LQTPDIFPWGEQVKKKEEKGIVDISPLRRLRAFSERAGFYSQGLTTGHPYLPFESKA
jgi:hypothetical protein